MYIYIYIYMCMQPKVNAVPQMYILYTSYMTQRGICFLCIRVPYIHDLY